MTRKVRRNSWRHLYDTPEWREYVLAAGGPIRFFGPRDMRRHSGQSIADYQIDLADKMRIAWDLLRPRLLPPWISAHPGTRPYAEWVCRLIPAHGHRLKVAGGGRPHSEVRPAGATILTAGMPYIMGVPRYWLRADEPPLEFEPEAEYLARHNQLTAAERQTLNTENT